MTNPVQLSTSIWHGALMRAAFAFPLLCALTTVVPSTAHAQTLTVLHSFTGGNDGGYPEGTLIADRAGNFYSTTSSGGLGGAGTVFKLSHQGAGWVLTPLYGFHGRDGAAPQLGLIFGPDDTLYGTTYEGGNTLLGTIYNLRPSPTVCRSVSCPWSLTILYIFQGMNDSINPTGAVVFDQAGNLYGTAFGSNFSDKRSPGSLQGSVWELVHSGGEWTMNVLWGFTSGDAQNPAGGVIFDQAGNLYGTSYGGGDRGSGTVFELTPSQSGWTEQTLHVFEVPGTNPLAGLTWDQQGNLLGATYLPGYAFELTPFSGGWNYNTLAQLEGSGLGPYSNLTIDSHGDLYGTTSEGGSGQGNVFKLSQSGGVWTYTNLHTFTGGEDGAMPSGSVTLDANGNLYGTATNGGTYGFGTVWKLTP